MTDFYITRLPPGKTGAELAQFLNEIQLPFRVVSKVGEITGLMEDFKDFPILRSPEGFSHENAVNFESEEAGGTQRLIPRRDSHVQTKTTGMTIVQGITSLLPEVPVVVGGSTMMTYFSLLQPRPLNAVDILMESTTPGEGGCSIMFSSGISPIDSVVKKEQQQKTYPLFSKNPPIPTKQSHLLHNKDAETLVKEEQPEEFIPLFSLDSPHPQQNTSPLFSLRTFSETVLKEEAEEAGIVERLFEAQDINEGYGDSEYHTVEGEELTSGKAQKGALVDVSIAFIQSRQYKCKLCNTLVPTTAVMDHWNSHRHCDFCGKRFSNVQALADHKRSHNVCHVCEESFSSIGELTIHSQTHKDESPFQWMGDIHRLNVGGDRCVHSKTSGVNPCNVQRTSFVSKVVDNPFNCNLCDAAFPSYILVINHRNCHPECNICGVRIRSQKALSVHKRRHHDDDARMDLTVERPRALLKEAKTGRKRRNDGVVERVIKEDDYAHCESLDKQAGEKDSEKTHKDDPSYGRFNCNLCSASFPSLLHLARRTHSQCSICEVSFASKRRNYGVVERVIKEDDCANCESLDKQAGEKDSEKTHKDAPSYGRFKCNLCSASFPSLLHLARHTHSQCPICEIPFASKDDIFAHNCTGRLDDRSSFVCDVCQKRYTCRSKLERHLRSHTGGKPFKCDVCHKCFTRKSHLKCHSFTHTGKKPHERVCQQRFAQKSDLKTHMHTHIGERPYGCPE